MGSALSFVPPISQLKDTTRGGLRIMQNANHARKIKADFVRYLDDVIILLNKSLCSLNAEDSERVRILIRKLTITLRELSKQSSARTLREMYLSGTHRFDEIREEVDLILKLIQLKSTVELQSVAARLTSITEKSSHLRENSVATYADNSSPDIKQANCECGLRSLTIDDHLSSRFQDIHDSSVTARSASRLPSIQGQVSSGIPEGVGGMEGFSDTLVAAFKNVEHHCLLVRTTGDHQMCLANSLNLLARLLKESGRVKEAVAYNREALELHLAAANHGC